MAQFTGTGSLIFGGTEQKVYDCEFVGSGQLVLDGTWNTDVAGCHLSSGMHVFDGASNTRISNCYFIGPLTIEQSDNVIVASNTFDVSGPGIVLDEAGATLIDGNLSLNHLVVGTAYQWLTITDNQIRGGGQGDEGINVEITLGESLVNVSNNALFNAGIYIDASTASGDAAIVVADNSLNPGPDQAHSVAIFDTNRPKIEGNNIWTHATIDSDAIHISDCNGALIDHNQIRSLVPGSSPRYGINIAGGNDNIVVGNNLGAAADYDTAPIGDSGTGTVLTYPGGTYGDNFTL